MSADYVGQWLWFPRYYYGVPDAPPSRDGSVCVRESDIDYINVSNDVLTIHTKYSGMVQMPLALVDMVMAKLGNIKEVPQ